MKLSDLYKPPLYKYYVPVETLMKADGSLVPLAVFFQGRRFEIEKILEVTETFSRAGGCGIRYTCRILGQERNLFWERNKWFLESSKKVNPY